MEHLTIEVRDNNATTIIKRSDACTYGLRFAFLDAFWDDMEDRLPVIAYHTKDAVSLKIKNQYIEVESPRRYILLQPSFFKSLVQTEAGAHVIEFFGRTKSYKVTIQWDVPLKAPVPWANSESPEYLRPCTNIQLSVKEPKDQIDGDIWYQDITDTNSD